VFDARLGSQEKYPMSRNISIKKLGAEKINSLIELAVSDRKRQRLGLGWWTPRCEREGKREE